MFIANTIDIGIDDIDHWSVLMVLMGTIFWESQVLAIGDIDNSLFKSALKREHRHISFYCTS